MCELIKKFENFVWEESTEKKVIKKSHISSNVKTEFLKFGLENLRM